VSGHGSRFHHNGVTRAVVTSACVLHAAVIRAPLSTSIRATFLEAKQQYVNQSVEEVRSARYVSEGVSCRGGRRNIAARFAEAVATASSAATAGGEATSTQR